MNRGLASRFTGAGWIGVLIILFVVSANQASSAELPSVDRTALHFAALLDGPATSAQVVFLERAALADWHWTAQASRPWLAVDPPSGIGPARLVISIRAGALSGPARTEEASVVVEGDASQRLTIHVTLTLLAGTGQPPFGAVDLPPDGVVVAGATQVMGWALDDLQVADVAICRDRPETMAADRESAASCGDSAKSMVLGHAVFSDGGRPDIERIAPITPLNTRSAWSFVLDPGKISPGASGTFRLSAIARDAEGHSALLGSRLVTVQRPAPAPFWNARGPKGLLLLLCGFGALHALVWRLYFKTTGVPLPEPVAATVGAITVQKTDWRERLLVGSIVAVFVWINLPWMTRGLEYDELYTTSHFVVGVPIWKTASFVSTFNDMNNHIGYSVLARAATSVFGIGEWVVRLPALVLACLTIYMVWRLARTFSGPLVAALTAATLALSPFFGQWAHTARGYSGLALMTVVSSYDFLRLLRAGSPRIAARYAIAATLAMYFQVFGLLIVAVQYAFFLGVARAHARQPTGRQAFDARGLGLLWQAFAAVVVATALLHLPVATRWIELTEFMEVTRGGGRSLFQPGFVADLTRSYASTRSVAWAIALIAVIAVGVFHLRKQRLQLGYLIAILAAPCLTMWLIIRPVDLYPRFYAYWLPVLAYFVGHGLVAVWEWAAWWRTRQGGMASIAAPMLAVSLSAGVVGLAVDWLRQDTQSPPPIDYRHYLAARDGAPARRTVAVGPDSEMFDYYLGRPLTVLHFPQELDRAMRAEPIRVAYHNMPWNSPDDRQMAALLGRRCLPDDRGSVIVFNCGQ